MDQYNGGNGGGYPPQGGETPSQGFAPAQEGYAPFQPAYVPQTAYMPPQAPAKKKNLWIWIGGAAALVLALVLVLVLTLSGGGKPEIPAHPILFLEDGDVYLAVGAEKILLDDAEFAYGYDDSLDAYMTVDGSYLFYLANANSSGEGDLMRIALGNPKAKPESMAEDVYTARISADGKKILYVTDVDEGEGDLYLCSPGGKAERIEKSVQTSGYGFSPNGSMFFYKMNSGKDAETIMLYKNGKATEVEEVEDAWVSDIFLDDSGRLLFDTYSSEESGYTLYLYSNGSAERISRDAYFLTVFGSAEEFLYLTGDDELYYYKNGSDEQIGEEISTIKFPTWPGRDPRAEREKHFVFSEGSSGERTLYEVNIPGDPVKVGKSDSDFIVDQTFRYAVYETDETLYLSRKEGREWSRREEICENPAQYAIDEDSRYLYYISCDDGEYIGDLCRIPLNGGDEEVLLKDTASFTLWKGSVYALTDEGDAYLVKSKKDSTLIENDITSFYIAESGIYLTGDDDELYFYDGKKIERISREATLIEDYGAIVSPK